jgi:hypothetical protein
MKQDRHRYHLTIVKPGLSLRLRDALPATLASLAMVQRPSGALAAAGAPSAAGCPGTTAPTEGAPSAFLNAQRKQPDQPIVPTLRLLSRGGAPKPPEVFFEVKRELHIPVVHGMGMTEVPMAVMGTPHDTDEQLAYTDGKPVHGAVSAASCAYGGRWSARDTPGLNSPRVGNAHGVTPPGAQE